MDTITAPPAPLIDLDNLRTLLAIAETGNFSAAAEALGRTPSAISMQVKKVEELLGRPVFRREPRRVRLTIDGEQLVAHARRMLALNREVMSRFASRTVQGEVRLGAPDDVSERFLPPMLRRFAESHPSVTVTVVVEGSARILELHRAGQIDLGLISCNTGIEGNAGADKVFEEKLIWAALAGGVAAERDPLPLSVWEESCVWRQAAIAGLEAQGRSYRIAFHSAHITGQRAAIAADLAVAPLPVSSLSGRIVEAPRSAGLPQLPSYSLELLTPSDPSPPVAAAAEYLRAAFARET